LFDDLATCDVRISALTIHPFRYSQISDVKNVIRNYHIEVPASHKGDLDEVDILTRLRRAGGANYDRQTSAY
jgi:hypothetical protein